MMNAEPSPSPAASVPPGRSGAALIWLAIFLYLPFLIAHGFDAWKQPAVDFPPFYFATRAVFDHQASPYGEGAFQEHAATLGRWLPPYIYPPPSLLLFYPFHFFSYDGAKALLLVANHLCLLFAIVFIYRKLFREEFARAPAQLTAVVCLAYALLFDPAVVTMHLGQVNLLLLVCLCLTWNALKRNAGALAIALPLSLAIVIKTYPVLLLVLLAFRRRYRAAAVTVALFGAYCAASYILLPSGIWEDWLTKVVPNGTAAHPGPWNQNIRAFVARAIMPNDFSEPLAALPALVKPINAALSLAVVAATLWCSFRRWREPESARGVDLEMSLYLFMIFLIAPVSWEHHFTYLLPALVLLIVMLFAGEVRGHWRWIVALSLCLIAWRLPIFGEGLRKSPWTLLISAKFYPAVALWVFLVAQLLRLRTRPPAADPTRRHEPVTALA